MLRKTVEKSREQLDFDSLLAVAGRRNPDGTIRIEQVLGCDNIAPSFIGDYPALAGDDVVGQLFAAYPRVVQTISVDDYMALGERETGSVAGARAGRQIAAYLRKYRIAHLLLAGLDSSFGLAWVTFYRHEGGRPFDAQDAESAKYLVPSLLYEWQRQACTRECLELPSRLLPLTARELQIAVMSAQGLLPKTIADRLDLSVSTVREVIQNIRERLGISGRKLTSDDLERHVHAPRNRAMGAAALSLP